MSSEIQFTLGELEEKLARLVQRLFDPVCLVFDFYRPGESFYLQAIEVAARKVR